MRLSTNKVGALLRSEQSVALWTEEWGPHGYFDYIEEHLDQVPGLQDLNYTIPVEI